MGRFHTSLNDDDVEFITSQPIFYIATAPWAGTHINVSPKGQPSRTFSVMNSTTVAYLDATGTGCETISHLYENGRATLLFCSFGPKPQTLRLFCTGRVIEKWDPFYQQVRAKMASENGDSVDITGARAIIVLKIQKIQTSCGFSLPQFNKELEADGENEAGDAVVMVNHHDAADADAPEATNQDTLDDWARRKVERRELSDFQKAMNHRSLDGLPGMMSARRAYDENIAVEDTKAWLRKVSRQQDAVALGFGFGIVFMILMHLCGFIHIQPSFIYHILNFQRRQMGLEDDDSWRKTEL